VTGAAGASAPTRRGHDAPDDLVEELSFRYIEIYEKLTGKKFEYNADKPIHDRIQENLNNYFKKTYDLLGL
jgi:predicted TPR repeat methyltransferase